MNRSRILILVIAAVAAGAAALLVRGLLGGGTEKSSASIAPVQAHMETSEVLVAAKKLDAGSKLAVGSVRWQAWPKSAVDSSFMTQNNIPDLQKAIDGVVVRAPVVEGEPLTAAKMVRADGAGYMAAMMTPGMRAVSINLSTETGAGGFILPNDRVDVILTLQVSESPRVFGSRTILKSVRVLAIDQTYQQDSDQKIVKDAKSATLEISPGQAELIERAQASGTLSLALRALGDTGVVAKADEQQNDGDVSVIRYGVTRGSSRSKGE
ncbi:MAG: Flp pilus assembly protein CpaB [Proteobacteria bacterium]|nr:Flp pilus assembly protein CpaB [Pseudomonadota bacterium]